MQRVRPVQQRVSLTRQEIKTLRQLVWESLKQIPVEDPALNSLAGLLVKLIRAGQRASSTHQGGQPQPKT